jgi:hypothetical protein
MPEATRLKVIDFLNEIKLPRSVGIEHKRAFRSSNSNPKMIPKLKAHTNHNFALMGLLGVVASFPRPQGSLSGAKVLKFVVALQQAHRTICRCPLTPQVSCTNKP